MTDIREFAQYDPPPITSLDDVGLELLRLSAILRLIAEGSLSEYHAAPDKVWDGRIVLADGSDWDPGSGQGVYCYYNSTWNYLG